MAEDPTDEIRRRMLDDVTASLSKMRQRDFASRDVQTLMELELDRAQLSYVTGTADVGDVKEALARSAGAGQACAQVVLRAHDRDTGGEVSLSEPGLPARDIPPAALAFALDNWVCAYSTAIMAHDMASIQLLCTAEIIGACTPPGDVMDEVWAPYCGMLAAAAVAPQHLDLWIEQVGGEMAKPEAASDVITSRLMPVFEMAKAMAAGRAAAVVDALRTAVELHRAFWQAEDLTHHPRAGWPLEATALAVLALDRQLVSEADLAGFPAELPVPLLQPEPAPALSRTDVTWPLRAVLSAVEANWFLDLRGVPRTGRRHQVVMLGNHLAAIYEFSCALVPHGTARFALVDAFSETDAPPALDAGELLILAERFGSGVPPEVPDETEMQAYRDMAGDAVAAVDAALARIPAGADAVPPDSLTSAAGKALFDGEPGRFRKDRLEAYRGGMAKALSSMGRRPASARTGHSPGKASDAMAQSMAAAEVIKANVAEMLQSLAGEDGADLARSLMPDEADFAAAFAEGVRDEAAKGYRAEWGGGAPEVDPLDDWRDLEIDVAAAGLLRTKNALSDNFPGAYLEIADKLVPHNVWVCWRYVTQPDGSGERYDGLVWLNGRWVWFPKPWRYFDRPTRH